MRVTNEAGITLYKKLGFEITRTINGYYSDGEDAYVMTKRLTKLYKFNYCKSKKLRINSKLQQVHLPTKTR